MLPYPSPPLFTVTRVPNALMRRNNMVIKLAYDSSQILEPLFSVRPINRPVTLGAVPRSNRIDPSSSSFLSLSLSFRGAIELQRYRQSRVINSRRKDVRSLVGNGVKMGQAVVRLRTHDTWCSSTFDLIVRGRDLRVPFFPPLSPSLSIIIRPWMESNVFSRSLFASVINMGRAIVERYVWGQVGAWILR